MAETKIIVKMFIEKLQMSRWKPTTQATVRGLHLEDSTVSNTGDMLTKVHLKNVIPQMWDIMYAPFAVSQDIIKSTFI